MAYAVILSTAVMPAFPVSAQAAGAHAGWDPWEEPARAAATQDDERLDLAIGEEVNPVRLAGLLAIRLYQVTLSPVLAARCQFHPSCSRYAFEAVSTRGFLNGVLMGSERVSRCHGMATLGGYPRRGPDGLLEDPPALNPSPLPFLSCFGL